MARSPSAGVAGLSATAGRRAQLAQVPERAVQVDGRPRRGRSRSGTRPRRSGGPGRRVAPPSGGPRTGTATSSRVEAITSGPNVRLGTNRPSITSHWMRSTPAFSSAITSSPRRAKSAGRTDGAISIGRSVPGLTLWAMAERYPVITPARPSASSAASAASRGAPRAVRGRRPAEGRGAPARARRAAAPPRVVTVTEGAAEGGNAAPGTGTAGLVSGEEGKAARPAAVTVALEFRVEDLRGRPSPTSGSKKSRWSRTPRGRGFGRSRPSPVRAATS